MIALSSATKKALIAIDIKGKKACLDLDEKIKHSENILPQIDNLLGSLSLSIKDNDIFAVVVGPGSFTGIRVGMALIKGFCAGERKKVVPLSTLSFMAYVYIKQNSPQTNFATIINALSGFYFFCEFDQTGSKIGQEKLVTKEELDQISLKKISLKEEALTENVIDLNAQHLLEYAQKAQKQGEEIDAHKLCAVYLRKSQAEANLEEKKLKNS